MSIIKSLTKKHLLLSTIRILRASRFLWKIRLKHGKDTAIFIVRGKTGDAYLYFRFLSAFLKQEGIRKYILVGDAKNINAIKNLYPEISCDIISTSFEIGLGLQSYYCLTQPFVDNLYHSLMWDVDLPINRCSIRLTDRFSYIDSYYWFLFHLQREQVSPTYPTFRQLNTKEQKDLSLKGIEKGNTVILAPYAYCVKNLDPLFWRLVAKDLKKRGYIVFVMLDLSCELNDFELPDIFFRYDQSVPVLEYAGHFIGLRSGFCDIISSAKCNKVILYPQKPSYFDGSVHRADKEYSSLLSMELDNNSCEITVPFCRDISNHLPETENISDRYEEEKLMMNKILQCFPNIRNDTK